MIVADNGADWFVSGAADRRWNDHDLDQLKRVPGAAFEVVRSGALHRG
jgi:xylose isomerase